MATTGGIANHPVVSRREWINARTALLKKEKEFTRERDELSRLRRALPWVKVEIPYVFDGPDGKATLAELFEGRSQLVVYHFMFAPEWDQGCKHCSFWADHFDALQGTYQFLDLVPKGRDEEGLKSPQAWVRYHDRYE